MYWYPPEGYPKSSPARAMLFFGIIGLLLKLFGTDEIADIVGNVFLAVAFIMFLLYLYDRSHKKT